MEGLLSSSGSLQLDLDLDDQPTSKDGASVGKIWLLASDRDIQASESELKTFLNSRTGAPTFSENDVILLRLSDSRYGIYCSSHSHGAERPRALPSNYLRELIEASIPLSNNRLRERCLMLTFSKGRPRAGGGFGRNTGPDCQTELERLLRNLVVPRLITDFEFVSLIEQAKSYMIKKSHKATLGLLLERYSNFLCSRWSDSKDDEFLRRAAELRAEAQDYFLACNLGRQAATNSKLSCEYEEALRQLTLPGLERYSAIKRSRSGLTIQRVAGFSIGLPTPVYPIAEKSCQRWSGVFQQTGSVSLPSKTLLQALSHDSSGRKRLVAKLTQSNSTLHLELGMHDEFEVFATQGKTSRNGRDDFVASVSSKDTEFKRLTPLRSSCHRFAAPCHAKPKKIRLDVSTVLDSALPHTATLELDFPRDGMSVAF